MFEGYFSYQLKGARYQLQNVAKIDIYTTNTKQFNLTQFDIHKSLADNVIILNLAPFIIDCQLCHFSGIKYILWADRCPFN